MSTPDRLRVAALRNAAAIIATAADWLASAERELVALGFDVSERVTRDPAAAAESAKDDALSALELVRIEIERKTTVPGDAAHPDSKDSE